MNALWFTIPQESGQASNVKAICKRIGAILDALSEINPHVCKGRLTTLCESMKSTILHELEAEGWIVTIPKNNYRVKPPKDYYKRQYMAETEGRGNGKA